MNAKSAGLISHLHGPIATLAAFLFKDGRSEDEIKETILRVFKIEDSKLRAQVQQILAVAAMIRELRGAEEAESFDDVNIEEVERQFEDVEPRGQLHGSAAGQSDKAKVVPIFRGRRAAAGSAPTLPGYLAPGEKRKMAAKRAVRPPQKLGHLRLAEGGSMEIGSDDVAVLAKFSRGQQSSAIEIGSAQHELRPSKTYFGYFEVQNLTPEKASELIQRQREAPHECIVSRINT